MNEIWKDVIGYKNIYEVSNLGRIRSRYYGKSKILKPVLSRWGYFRLTLCKDGIRKNESVHRLVALAFIDNPFNKLVVNHKDENKQNNNCLNLEWATYSENNFYGTAREKKVLSLNWAEKAKKCKKPVLQFDKQGIFIKLWNSAKDVFDSAKINSSTISACCKNKRKTAGGYIWKFAGIPESCPIKFNVNENGELM